MHGTRSTEPRPERTLKKKTRGISKIGNEENFRYDATAERKVSGMYIDQRTSNRLLIECVLLVTSAQRVKCNLKIENWLIMVRFFLFSMFFYSVAPLPLAPCLSVGNFFPIESGRVWCPVNSNNINEAREKIDYGKFQSENCTKEKE